MVSGLSRWARRVQPAVLQVLMRHANIRTTMEYYATLQAEETAAAIAAAFERAKAG
jgi:integrase